MSPRLDVAPYIDSRPGAAGEERMKVANIARSVLVAVMILGICYLWVLVDHRPSYGEALRQPYISTVAVLSANLRLKADPEAKKGERFRTRLIIYRPVVLAPYDVFTDTTFVEGVTFASWTAVTNSVIYHTEGAPCFDIPSDAHHVFIHANVCLALAAWGDVF